jgi:hypothetical protein
MKRVFSISHTSLKKRAPVWNPNGGRHQTFLPIT